MGRKMRTRAALGSQTDWNGTHYETLLTAHETGGKLGAFASDAGPGDGPPRHRHFKSDEVFVILEGRLRFWCAGKASDRIAGEVFYIPAGVEHAFVVVERARWIAILSPGGSKAFSRRLPHRDWRFRATSRKSKRSRPSSIWR
ncbi:cupin domain-containing protein [Mesorhizobium sp. ORM16]|uniref:cupin domain-containing protein n=1 Tax=Mesorhizobium sp. ORM16 TaxID=3376989 RepID=UPI0038573433